MNKPATPSFEMSVKVLIAVVFGNHQKNKVDGKRKTRKKKPKGKAEERAQNTEDRPKCYNINKGSLPWNINLRQIRILRN